MQEEDDIILFTDKEDTIEVEDELLETNSIKEMNYDLKVAEQIFENERVIAPEKDGLLKRLTKCFFSRQSA